MMRLLTTYAAILVAIQFLRMVWEFYQGCVMMKRHDVMDSHQRCAKHWQDEYKKMEDAYRDLLRRTP